MNRRGFISGLMAACALPFVPRRIVADESIRAHQLDVFNNGKFPVLWNHDPKQKLTPAQRQKLIAEWRRMYSGAIKYGDSIRLKYSIRDIV